ncbi:MAG: sugar phosphate isomerase/epimerase family protein [Planctomycetota bacterium]
MKYLLSRRNFLQTSAVIGTGVGLCSLSGTNLFSAPVSGGAPNAEKIGWKLGCQAYSFRLFTFYDAIDKVASLGLHYIEGFPKQKLNEQVSTPLAPALSSELRREVKQRLADQGVKLANYGVTPVNREIMEFCKDMGIETVVSEPDPKELDAVEKLAEELDLKVAIHNHPKPSRYWDPAFALESVQGRSPRIGVCADTGHWLRSGLDPVECLKKLEGRIISLHFKDLNAAERKAHDVPWGTGVSNARAQLEELYRQKFQGVFSIEYEHNWENSVPEIAQCVEFFNKTAGELAA